MNELTTIEKVLTFASAMFFGGCGIFCFWFASWLWQALIFGGAGK